MEKGGINVLMWTVTALLLFSLLQVAQTPIVGEIIPIIEIQPEQKANVILEVVERPQTNEDLIVEYLAAHPVEDFANVTSRVRSFTIDEKGIGHLNYTYSAADPSVESFYWVGVVYKVFPEVKATWVEGYNYDDKLIVNTKRYHPSNEQYFFDNYRWFGEGDY
ncbi:MAG: hypothetical protein ABIG20_03785 [archaeon]